ncbi:hypothetical protein MYRA21_0112 [Myroides sp. A21]|nr:hypothetical protein MYRA21_0112 [Myroides sp. A21]
MGFSTFFISYIYVHFYLTPIGVSVLIENTNSEIVHQIYDEKNRKELSQKFASYWINYRDFNIYINNKKLEFESLIKNSDETEHLVHTENLTHRFKIKVIEWNFDIKKKHIYVINKEFHLEKLILEFVRQFQSQYLFNQFILNHCIEITKSMYKNSMK